MTAFPLRAAARFLITGPSRIKERDRIKPIRNERRSEKERQEKARPGERQAERQTDRPTDRQRSVLHLDSVLRLALIPPSSLATVLI